MIDSASGRYESPALIALKPSTFCMYSEMKKNMLNRDAPVRIPTTFAPVRVRFRKIEKGISGEAEPSSIATNAAIMAAAAASRPIVWPEPQPASGASISA